MHRNVTNIIRYVMDELLPPQLRDARWFMYLPMYYAFKGKNVKRMMDFKDYAMQLSDEEFTRIYNEVDCIGNDRETDLNTACVKRILFTTKRAKMKILDVGCGRGFLAKKLIEQGHEVHGCDIKELQIPGLKFQIGSVEKLSYADHSFDIVICTHTLEHVRHLDKAIAELKRVTKNKIIIVVPKQYPYHYTLDLHLQFFYHKEELTNRVGLKNYVCENLGGDWYYEGNII